MDPNETKHTPETPSPVHDGASEARSGADHETDTVTGSIDHHAIMGILCYLGPFVLVPYLTERDTPFVKFHIKQGLVLLGFAILSFLISSFAGLLFIFAVLVVPFIILLNLFLLILVILGIVNVIKGKQKPLPLIGDLANKIHI